jgi:hypothetical protein
LIKLLVYARLIVDSNPAIITGNYAMTDITLADLQNGFFSDRDTLAEAWEYASRVVNALPPHDRLAVVTAMMVVINTLAKLEQDKDGLPSDWHADELHIYNVAS